MANEVKVNPTPIQRNVLDVATELTQFYYRGRTVKDADTLAQTFMKFYVTAAVIHGASFSDYKNLKDLVPNELHAIIEKW